VSGLTAMTDDLTEQLADTLPVLIAAILAASFLLLMVLFRSLALPLKAAVVNLVSIGGFDLITIDSVDTNRLVSRWALWLDGPVGRGSGAMHVDTSRRHYTAADGSVREYRRHLLRRSFRDDRGRPQKETLANLSDLPDEAIEAVRTVLAGRTLVEAGTAFTIERALPHGDVAAAHAMAAKLGVKNSSDRTAASVTRPTR